MPFLSRLLRIISLVALPAASAASQTHAARYTIRWVLVHDHGEAVQQAARDFAERVERETNGDVRVQILSRSQYGKQRKDGSSIGELALLQDVTSGKVEIIQTYTKSLGRHLPDLDLLAMPYLFRDYAHAERVLEGPIGRELLASFRGLPVRPLAFTYSGGFGFFASSRELRAPESLRGLRIQTMRGLISRAIARRLEFENLAVPPEAFVPLAQHGLADGLESTYSCFVGYGDDRYAKIVTETGHFLLTTMVVANSAFLDHLPTGYRQVVEQAVLNVARKERQDSIALNAFLRRQMEQRGVTIIDLTTAEKSRYRELLSAVYKGPVSDPRNLIGRIRQTGSGEGAAPEPKLQRR